MFTNFFLLQDPHNGCMLPMLSEPPLVSLQYGFGIAASQTSVAVTLAKLIELIGGKTA
jgi:hypothetical protein